MKHNLKYDITSLKSGERIIEAFPDLAAYPEFKHADDKLLAYVFYAYDIGSGLMKFKEPIKRREEALLHAGFEKNKQGNWNDARCEAILQLKDLEVNKMIFRFLRSIMHSLEFAFWINGLEMLWQNAEKIAIPIESEEDKADAEDGMSVADAKKLMKRGTEKEKDVQSAYTTRNAIFKEMPTQIKILKETEKVLFPDTETRDMAADEVSQTNAGYMEEWVAQNKKK